MRNNFNNDQREYDRYVTAYNDIVSARHDIAHKGSTAIIINTKKIETAIHFCEKLVNSLIK